MNRHATLSSVLVLTAALLVGSPASAQNPELKYENLSKEVRELKEEVAALRLKRLADVQARIVEVKLIDERLERIEKMLARLVSPPRISSSFSPTTPAATGTLRLDNRLTVTATVYIDGTAYTIPPLSTRTLPNYPARALTYEATGEGLGMGAPVRSSLGANETLTVTIY